MAKAKVKADFDSIMRSCEAYNFENLAVYLFDSEYRMAGYIASVLSENGDKTILAINKKDGSGSLRGDLAEYWKHNFKDFGYITVDGHPGFMGANLNGKPETLIEELSKRFGIK